MERRGTKAVVVIAVGAAMAAASMYVLTHGFSAKDEPSAIEAFLARRLRHLAVPHGARELVNPVPSSPEVLARATEHFADHCASCHGNDGRGMTLIGRGLYPKPPDMTETATQQLSDGELYSIIENGVRFTGMPAFGEEPGNNNDTETWDLVHFIRHLPQMSDEEAVEMKKLNPKSPGEIEREERMRKFLEGDDTAPSESNHEHHHH